MFVFRLRDYSCLQVLLDELSALIDKRTMMNIYQEAIKEPLSCLMIKLREKTDLNNMFMICVGKRVTITCYCWLDKENLYF